VAVLQHDPDLARKNPYSRRLVSESGTTLTLSKFAFFASRTTVLRTSEKMGIGRVWVLVLLSI
jgi:hypothetical protein